jgi:hypothetical protein
MQHVGTVSKSVINMIISSTGPNIIDLHHLEHVRKKKFRPFNDPELLGFVLSFLLYTAMLVLYTCNFAQKGANTT